MNREKTLGRAIKSLKAQTFQDFEHIVVDGCSSDGTLSVARAEINSSGRVFSEKDLGVYDALNRGLKLAEGEILGVLHSDDIFATPTVLERVHDIFYSQSADVVFGDLSYFKYSPADRPCRIYKSPKLSLRNLSYGIMPAHPATFMRAEIFELIGDYKIGYKIGGDFDYFCRLAKLSNLKVVYLPEILVKMRIGGLSTSGWNNRWIINKEILRACSENEINSSLPKILMRYPIKLLELMAWR
jgi:glycosyltransferase involved in cell wall biosynthesis